MALREYARGSIEGIFAVFFDDLECDECVHVLEGWYLGCGLMLAGREADSQSQVLILFGIVRRLDQ